MHETGLCFPIMLYQVKPTLPLAGSNQNLERREKRFHFTHRIPVIWGKVPRMGSPNTKMTS